MSSKSQGPVPQEAGPRPQEVPVRTEEDHRKEIAARRQAQAQQKLERPSRSTVIRSKLPQRKVKESPAKRVAKTSVKAPRTNQVLSRFKALGVFTLRIDALVYSLLLGTPPDRVVFNRPPLRPLLIHRWIYFWFYVIFRIYKAKWLFWIPIPRSGVRRRTKASIVRIQDVQFHQTKFIASYSLKGGVGKTSLAKAAVGLIKRVRKSFNVLIQDNNPDRGTLADRGRRTVKHAIADLVENIAHIESLIDFTRYCNELEEGAWMLASTRPGDFSTELNITIEEFDQINQLEEDFFDLVYLDCGTDRQRETNLRALARADVIKLITTPAKDSINQAVASFVWMCNHPVLQNKHIVLVVNRKKWWNNLDKIQTFFIESARHEFEKVQNRGAVWRPKSFQTFGVCWDPRLALGLKFTSFNLRRAVQADEFEIEARCFELMADGFVSLPDSQLTHIQTATLGREHDMTPSDVKQAILQSVPATVDTTQSA